MDYTNLGITFVSAIAVTIPSASWLVKKYLENDLKKNIEKYKDTLKLASNSELEKIKVELKSKSDSELERLKVQLQSESNSELESLKSKHQILIKRRAEEINYLHQKRANAIEVLYVSLVELHEAAYLVLNIFSPKNPADIRKYTQDAFEKVCAVNTEYLKAKIYISPQTCEVIKDVIDPFRSSIQMYYAYQHNYDDHELDTISDVKDRSWKEIEESVNPAMKELEEEFRKLLGVKDS